VTGAEVGEFLALSAAFVADLERIVRRQLDQGPSTVAAITAAAEAELGPFPEMGIELARSVGAHLEEAAERGEARRAEGAGLTWEAASP